MIGSGRICRCKMGCRTRWAAAAVVVESVRTTSMQIDLFESCASSPAHCLWAEGQVHFVSPIHRQSL